MERPKILTNRYLLKYIGGFFCDPPPAVIPKYYQTPSYQTAEFIINTPPITDTRLWDNLEGE